VRTILHLCADTGSDTWPYRNDRDYTVHTIGSDIGVENYTPSANVHGIIANPVCTEFSTLRRHEKLRPSDPESGMAMVRECMRIIEQADPVWWAIENPATGSLRKYLGKPDFTYQPWEFGSPWTKRTALWGKFTAPTPIYQHWEEVPHYPLPHVRPNRRPSLAFMHKSAWHWIPEFRDSGMPAPTSDMELRSTCSQKFAEAFKAVNP
jgi:hypothetical protein